jgi:hypothetical protein
VNAFERRLANQKREDYFKVLNGGTMKREFCEENRASTEELKALVAGLSEADYQKPVGDGWTVATLLCHLALWDGRAAYTLQSWQTSGKVPSNVPADATDFINQAARDVFTAVPGTAAAKVAVTRAETLNAWLETLNDDFCEQVIAQGFERMLRRSLHRRSHLAQIRTALE